eukprot:403367092
MEQVKPKNFQLDVINEHQVHNEEEEDDDEDRVNRQQNEDQNNINKEQSQNSNDNNQLSSNVTRFDPKLNQERKKYQEKLAFQSKPQIGGFENQLAKLISPVKVSQSFSLQNDNNLTQNNNQIDSNQENQKLTQNNLDSIANPKINEISEIVKPQQQIIESFDIDQLRQAQNNSLITQSQNHLLDLNQENNLQNYSQTQILDLNSIQNGKKRLASLPHDQNRVLNMINQSQQPQQITHNKQTQQVAYQTYSNNPSIQYGEDIKNSASQVGRLSTDLNSLRTSTQTQNNYVNNSYAKTNGTRDQLLNSYNIYNNSNMNNQQQAQNSGRSSSVNRGSQITRQNPAKLYKLKETSLIRLNTNVQG